VFFVVDSRKEEEVESEDGAADTNCECIAAQSPAPLCTLIPSCCAHL